MRAFRVIKPRPSLKNRRAGDEARDLGDWPAAEQGYAAHLALVADDQPIWVQYGHALKEQGKTGEAEAAYRKAGTLRPGDAEARLQLGHLLSSLGRVDEAEAEYVAAAQIRPALAALVTRGAPVASLPNEDGDTAAMPGTNAIFLEIDDLLEYLKSYKTVSGIQRVQVGIITHAVAEIRAGNTRYSLVRTGRHGAVLLQFLPRDIEELLSYIRQPVTSQERQRTLIEAAEERAMPVQPREGQAYFVLGAFWGFGSNPARYSRLKAAGVRIGVYIYDLIPITHPEYCALGLVNEFTLALADGLHAFDFILTISEYVANSVRGFMARYELRPIPVQAVPLAHRVHDIPVLLPPEVEEDAWDGVLSPLHGRPFVLVVCTIEPRKNHQFLYWLWKSLVEEGLDPPDLVFVGRYGWRVNDFRDMLNDTGFLDGRIHVLHDLSDVDLELLYKACLFTAFPSIVEGWGLPVGESLSHGRPIIASSATSIPEVGGDFVDYVDPWDLTGAIPVFKRMMFDTEYRERRTAAIRQGFVPRTWDDVARDLLGHLDALRGTPMGVNASPLLRGGEILMPGELTYATRPPEDYAQRPLRPIFAEGWYPPEEFGMWMAGEHGVLRLKTDCAPGTRIVTYIQMTGAPWCSDHLVQATVGERPKPAAGPQRPRTPSRPEPKVAARATERFFFTASGEVGAEGSVSVTFKVQGPDIREHPAWNANDGRLFSVGLCKFAYAPAANLELRSDLFEQFHGTVQA